MKVRLLAPDSKYPNIAIMKISRYHKLLGNDVDWYNADKDIGDTDILYISKIFTFTEEPQNLPMNNNCVIYRGGTGYDPYNKLPQEIEDITDLDWSLYPNIDYSILFMSRGCIRQCKFCIVKEKEGLIHDIPLCSLNPNGKHIKIMDNNFFANPNWRKNIEILRSYNQPLEFNAGIDLRILNEEQCEELSKCKIKSIHCAWDNYKDKEIIVPKLKLLSKWIKPYKILCYVLVGFENKEVVDTDLERINTIWSLGIYPFVMGYINYNDKSWKKSKSVKNLARWCNNRFIFKKCKWEEYKNGQTSLLDTDFDKLQEEHDLFKEGGK